MSSVSVDDFCEETECIYEGEHYSVRDNGAVMRHARPGKRVRPLDNQWTFGRPNALTGYMEIVSVRVHRIVATAFHGVPLHKENVVDHIDTNRRNNRPENLRWLSRLENVLKNPYTRKKIEYLCGSIKAFLENPKLLPLSKEDSNFNWMRTVTKEEAANCLHNMERWRVKEHTTPKGTMGDWIFKDLKEQQPQVIDSRIVSLTPGAFQKDWHIPSEFPLCPMNVERENPLLGYAQNLQKGKVFCKNKHYESILEDFVISKDNNTIWIICSNETNMKPWSASKIIFDKGFVHISLGSFFERNGAEKTVTLDRGLVWQGPDGIDDYC